ncbi:MAG: hypothetical protein ACOC04_05230 [Halothece sp.]
MSKTNIFIRSLREKFQVKRLLSLVLVGFIFLATGVATEASSQRLTNRVDKIIHQDDSQRPKTTGEWKQEARETEGSPGERAKRIANESAEAVKDFGSIYPDTAKRSTPDFISENE